MQYDDYVSNLRESLFKNKNDSFINKTFFDTVFHYLKENDYVLDIGTGNGYVIREINNRAKFKLNLYGNDSSISMLKQTKNDENIKFILCDNYKLDFSSNFFDMVVAKNVTRFSAKEIYRILKPGGIFIYREYGKYKGLVDIGKMFSGRLIRSRNKSFYDNKLKKAGFTVLESRYIKENRIFSNVETIIKTVKSFPMIKNFNNKDETIIRNKYNNMENIVIKSDAFLAIYRKD